MFRHLQYFQQHISDVYPLAPHATLDAVLRNSITECPHLLFYGPEGGLKKEYLRIAVAGFYGVRAEDVRTKHHVQTLTINSNKHDVPIATTPYSMEFHPSELAAYDRHIISQIIKPIIMQKSPVRERHIIVFHDAHALSKQAMMTLRRMFEMYHSTTLFILVATSLSSVPEAIRSRCCLLRCPVLQKTQVDAICHSVSRGVTEERVPTERESVRVVSADPERDIYKRLLRLQAPVEPSDLIYDEVQTFMDGLRKCRTPWTTYDRIKEYVHRVLYYKYSNRQLLGALMAYLIAKYGNKAGEMIAIVAEADAASTQAQRPNFVYERMFLAIVMAAASC